MLLQIAQVLPYEGLQTLVSHCDPSTVATLALLNQAFRAKFLPFQYRRLVFDSRTCRHPQTFVQVCCKYGAYVQVWEARFHRSPSVFSTTKPNHPTLTTHAKTAATPTTTAAATRTRRLTPRPLPTLAPHTVVPYLTQVQSVSLSWSYSVPAATVRQWLALPCAEQLKALTLRIDQGSALFPWQPYDLPVASLCSMTGLTSLILGGFHSPSRLSPLPLTDAWLQVIETHPLLRNLTLPDTADIALLVQAITQKLGQLTTLILPMAHLDCTTWRALLDCSARLESLTLVGLTASQVSYLADLHPWRLPRLRHLAIQGHWGHDLLEQSEHAGTGSSHNTPQHQQYYSSWLAVTWPQLRWLSLEHLPLDEQCLGGIIRQCPHLTRLVLTHCLFTDTSTSSTHFLLAWPQLKHLTLRTSHNAPNAKPLLGQASPLATNERPVVAKYLTHLTILAPRTQWSELGNYLNQLNHLASLTLPRGNSYAPFIAQLRRQFPAVTIETV
ncbi:hypothetical protein H4R35_001103 [Dimargaris xerosporica]|nr:hypothetical protein H4R35_001103 [Dimargaris xerosporica]